MTQTAATDIERMTISRLFHAPRAVVWKAWTDPQYVQQWWGPQGFTCPVCRIDLRAGGKFLLGMKTPEGQDFFNAGEYHEIVPLEKIVSSMYFADAQGNKVEPEHYGIEHEAIADAHDVALFEDAGEGQTRLTVIGNESAEEARKSGQEEGWKQILDKVAAVVEELVQSGKA